MRIMLDTNVLISMLLFPNNRMDELMQLISTKYDLILSSYVVDELKAVVAEKFSSRSDTIDKLLTKMSYEFVYTPEEIPEELFEIRDKKDYPVLYTAIIEDVDILITGDKDFANVKIERPAIYTPSEFLENIGKL